MNEAAFIQKNYPERIQLVLTYKHAVDDPEIFTKKVDAVKVGDYYKIIHVPAFAPNLAYGDVVKGEFEDNEFHFDKLIKESGFRSINKKQCYLMKNRSKHITSA